MENVTRTMARFTRELQYEHLSPAAIELAKRFILDSVGCAFGGSKTGDVQIMRDFFNRMGGRAEATVINSPKKLPMINSCLLNSLMIRALDYNDIYWEQDPSHPSDLIPAALSPAEVLHKSGKELIVAVVLAYEWEQRLCEFAIPGIRERKWHHATLTQFAAPLVAGKILDLTEDQLVQAVGISASHNLTVGAVTAGKLTMMKNTVDPMATHAGLFAALLARHGYEGPEHVMDGKEGLTDTLGGRFDLHILTDKLGEDFRITRCSMKAFPTEALTHSPISAVIKLMKSHQLKKEDIDHVLIRTVARAADILSDPSKYDPRTRETADHSLPYCIAAIIVDGTVTPASFTDQKIMNPEIRAYLSKIKVVADAEIEKTFPALKRTAVEITTRTGQTYQLTVDYPLGDYREPMDDQTFYAKFDSMVLSAIPPKKRDRIVETIGTLEKLNNTADLMRMLAGKN
jgi:2-methylcitrate dehydratase